MSERSDGSVRGDESSRERTDRTDDVAFYEQLLENSSDLITVVDDDGVVTYHSPSVESRLGYRDGALVGETLFEYVHPDDRADLFDVIEDLVRVSTADTRPFEYRFRRADGSWEWLEAIGSTRADGPVEGVVLNARPVTRGREQEDLASVFHRVLRHNLRNELTIILGHANRLAETADDSAAVDAVTESAARLYDLAEDAQTLNSLIERTDREEIELCRLVPERIEQFAATYPDVAFETEVPESCRVVASEHLSLAVDHLIENAVEHNTAETPTVRVSVGPSDHEPARVDVTVADNGPGLPKQERDILQWEGESPTRHGDGLGLWIVNWVVTHSGGRLVVTDRDPTGTAVIMVLPESRGLLVNPI
ncbi:MAG: PAS domain S-box protein [Halobaculum sp.]